MHAPIAPTKECVRLVKELGEPVKYIVLTTYAYEHKVFVSPFARRFPKAQVGWRLEWVVVQYALLFRPRQFFLITALLHEGQRPVLESLRAVGPLRIKEQMRRST